VTGRDAFEFNKSLFCRFKQGKSQVKSIINEVIMKARIVFIILGIIGCALSGLAQEQLSPQQTGAYPAKLSDRAQIQLLLDELRSGEESGLKAQMVRKRFAAQSNTQITVEEKTVRSKNLPEIAIEGEKAVVAFANGEQLLLQKEGQQWRVKEGKLAVQKSAPRKSQEGNSPQIALQKTRGFSAGETFISTPLSPEYGIERLTRKVAEANLDRSLFGAPEKTASYYFARYSNSAPYVTATYIQLVTDPAWNRILYGSLGRWIKSYDDLAGPSAIAVDADGRVFIGETGRQGIRVLQLHPEEENTQLQYLFDISGISYPAGFALDDNGTPLDVSDDFLYVADPVENKIFKYALQSGGAALAGEFGNFDSPTTVLCGKWNGASSGFLYVIDKGGRRVQLLEDEGASLKPLREISGTPGQYFSAIKSDHFGNVYLVDNINSQLYKYTADLEFLDAQGGKETFDGLANIDIGFGKIIIEGEGAYWAGFDQLFTLERWSEQSGAQRRTLGVAINNATFQADEDISEISARFTLTDVADVNLNILDENDRLIAELPAGWLAAGEKIQVWNRRNSNGEQVAPGNYRCEISAKSPYREETINLAAQFYLPLYYWQDCGSAVKADDAFQVQGKAVAWGDSPSETAVEHPSAVVYRFRGLNPESEYMLNVECFAGDGVARGQEIVIDGDSPLARIEAGQRPAQTGYLTLPKESYAGGEVTVSVVNRQGGSAVVSQIWLKETGAGLNPQLLPEGEAVPQSYVLEQNYPNPFNPTTNIEFRIADFPEGASGSTELAIYDVLGRKIKTLLNENLSPGNYKLQWDGRSDAGVPVSSGIYFYRLTSGSFAQTKRMLLVR